MRPVNWINRRRVWRSARFLRSRRLVASCVVVAAMSVLGVPAISQYRVSEEPLLASAISTQEITLRGRYVREWQTPDGVIVLLYNGGFRLEMGQRRLRADNAVVWIDRRQDAERDRAWFELTVYLSEDAEVYEPGGTVTLDSVLLVRGLQTAGQIVRMHDAHAPEDLTASSLYQQALRDRAAIEAGEMSPHGVVPEVKRPRTVRRPRTARAPRVIRYRLPNVEVARTSGGDQVYVASGGVYFSQDGGANSAMLEIRADNAVVFPVGQSAGSLFGEDLEGAQTRDERSDVETDVSDDPAEPPPQKLGVPRGTDESAAKDESPGAPASPDDESDVGAFFGEGDREGRIQAVYLEGDVVLSLGHRFVRASRLYYDFGLDRALILDAVFRADIPIREIPLYVRADQIRQLSTREFSASDAVVTTSEFHTPSYHVGAERIVIRDMTQRDTAGRAVSPVSGEYEMTNSTLNIEGVPVLWWPYSEGELDASETLIRSVRTGYSSDRGAEVETSWHLFNLMGMKPPEGWDATLRLDYFSDRGPAVGVETDYAREDHYGLFRGYYIHDDGEDTLGPLRRYEEEPTTSERGRLLWRHRHYLPYDWEATVELSYISDPYFLEEWRQDEFHEGKEQETLLYLKRAKDVHAITVLANWRILDFYTQTEHLPELGYRRIGDTFASPFVLYHESRVGMLRYRPDDRRFFDERRFNNDGHSDLTFRGDVRQEAELPLKLGALNVVPFASVRGTYWDGQPLADGGLWRGIGVYGVRGGASFSRVYDELRSELFDINRVRHVIKPDFAAWWAHSNTRSELITPFDYGIETIDDFYGFMAGVRQVWQTKRGPSDDRRTVDLLTFDLEVGVFGDVHGRDDISNGYANPLRPENSRTRNYLAGDMMYRISDTTALLYDFNIDLNDFAYDRHNVALAIERNPRLAYVLGTRYAGDIDMSVVGGGWNYRLNEKHITTVRGWWDVDTGDLGEVSIGYVRKLPRWYVGLNFEYDNIDDDFTISLSLWPEGIPEWTLGSRRYTGLARTTGIRP